MKQFTKTLVAAALLAGTGVASASIQTGSNTLSEAYLSAYDSSRGITFNLDLGLTMGDLVTGVANGAFTKSYDLAALTSSSTGAKWSDFATGLNAATTTYGVVLGGTLGKFLATSSSATAPAKNGTVAAGNAVITSLTNFANVVNQEALADNTGSTLGSAFNLSAISLDTDNGGVGGTGQHNLPSTFNDLFGTKSDQLADIAYGQSGDFYYYNGNASITKAVYQWNLSGNTLTAASVAAVPLPAAVWLFGAGLMGMLRLNRRKSMAA